MACKKSEPIINHFMRSVADYFWASGPKTRGLRGFEANLRANHRVKSPSLWGVARPACNAPGACVNKLGPVGPMAHAAFELGETIDCMPIHMAGVGVQSMRFDLHPAG